MSYPSAELGDFTSTLERALIASLRLDRSADELGAIAVAVLLTEGPQIEVKYFRNRYVDADDHSVLDGQQDLSRAVESPSGPVDAGSPLALVLREWIAPDANSFLLFHWCFCCACFQQFRFATGIALTIGAHKKGDAIASLSGFAKSPLAP